MYEHYETSVGNNFKHVQITTKYRYKMMRSAKIATMCKVAIEEACKKHKIEIVIIKIIDEHVRLMLIVQELYLMHK